MVVHCGACSCVSIYLSIYLSVYVQVISNARHQANRWSEVMSQADRSVTLVDLCGRERYLKTTISGLTG